MKIKRTKTGEGGPNGLPPSTSTHWAVAVDAQGCVDSWTTHEGEAGTFGRAVIEKVRAHYAGQKNVGTLEFVGAYPPGDEVIEAEAKQATGKQLAEALAEVASLRGEVSRLQGVVEQRSRQDEGHAKQLAVQAQTTAEARKAIKALSDENAALRETNDRLAGEIENARRDLETVKKPVEGPMTADSRPWGRGGRGGRRKRGEAEESAHEPHAENEAETKSEE